MRQSRGLTLIELLVAVSIIGVLMALLLPVLAAGRRMARESNARQHLRQLVLATDMYTTEHGGRYPQPGEDKDLPESARLKALWFNALDDYLSGGQKAGERKQAAFKQAPVWQTLPASDRVKVRTFKMNAWFGNMGNNQAGRANVLWTTQAQVAQPVYTPLFMDGRGPDTPSATSGHVDWIGAAQFHAEEIHVGLRRAGGHGALVAACDGHVTLDNAPEVRQTGAGYRGWHAAGTCGNHWRWRVHD